MKNWSAMPDAGRAAVKQMQSQEDFYRKDTQLYPFHECIFMNKIISDDLTVLSRLSGLSIQNLI